MRYSVFMSHFPCLDGKMSVPSRVAQQTYGPQAI
jgi:hypothetical protein